MQLKRVDRPISLPRHPTSYQHTHILRNTLDPRNPKVKSYAHLPPMEHGSDTSNRGLSSGPIKFQMISKSSLPTIPESGYFDTNSHDLDRLFKQIGERPRSRYDGRDRKMEILMVEIDEIIRSCSNIQTQRDLNSTKLNNLPMLPPKNAISRSLSTSKTRKRRVTDGTLSAKRVLDRSSSNSLLNISQSSRFHSKDLNRTESPFEIVANFNRNGSSRNEQLTYFNRPKVDGISDVSRLRGSRSTSRLGDHSYLDELEKSCMIKDIPSSLQKSYLSNVKFYKNFISVQFT